MKGILSAEDVPRAAHEPALEGVVVQVCPAGLAAVLLAILLEPLGDFVLHTGTSSRLIHWSILLLR